MSQKSIALAILEGLAKDMEVLKADVKEMKKSINKKTFAAERTEEKIDLMLVHLGKSGTVISFDPCRTLEEFEAFEEKLREGAFVKNIQNSMGENCQDKSLLNLFMNDDVKLLFNFTGQSTKLSEKKALKDTRLYKKVLIRK